MAVHRIVAAARAGNAASAEPVGVALVRFLAARRSGELDRWLGAEASARVREGGGLVRELGDAVRALSGTVSDPAGQEWQHHVLPLLDGPRILKVELFARREEAGGEAGGGTRGQRFVLDASSAGAGRFQLEGRLDRRERRLDLVLRSERALAAEARQDIRSAFHRAREAVRYAGGVRFLGPARAFVAFQEDVKPGTRADLIV
jgi:hypothetical protein